MSVYYDILDLCSKDTLTDQDLSSIKEIIESNNLDFNHENEAWKAMVSVAAYHGHVRALEIFFQNGLNITDPTALDGAAEGKQKECVEYLLREGADPNSIKNSTSYHCSSEIAAILDQKCIGLSDFPNTDHIESI